MANEHGQERKDENHVDLRVVTGAGNYPESGFRSYNIHEKLGIVLQQAAKELKLQNTEGWVAKSGERELDPARTIGENQIQDEAKIFWAPKEPGGGADRCTRN
jgi:hypothetical protein